MRNKWTVIDIDIKDLFCIECQQLYNISPVGLLLQQTRLMDNKYHRHTQLHTCIHITGDIAGSALKVKISWISSENS